MSTTNTLISYLDSAVDAAASEANDASFRGDWKAGERLERVIDQLEDRYDDSFQVFFGAS